RNSVVVIRLRGVWEKVRVFASKLVFSFPETTAGSRLMLLGKVDTAAEVTKEITISS
nr:hypothetical protein [Tanacetum cinerariifolium]